MSWTDRQHDARHTNNGRLRAALLLWRQQMATLDLMEETLPLNAAARFLQVSERKLRYLVAGNKIPSSKPGKTRVFRRSALVAYLVSLENAGAHNPGARKDGTWVSDCAAQHGGPITRRRVARELDDLLKPATKNPPRNCTTN
ncbi:helix-turn-helix domain-containing protein [Microvirgula aerodenitrificans]|uniref:helix-turn-helix domain-containing protein n=2 Tax=Microvirgula aerodenitrificans TaxID=57480 RepID=UPI000A03A5A5